MSRDRLLGPVHAGRDLLDPTFKGFLAFVEPVDIAIGAGQFVRLVAKLDVAAHRHPVADVVGDEGKPEVFVPSLVEQIRLAIKEILDLLFQQKAGETLVRSVIAHTARSLSAPGGGEGWPPERPAGPAVRGEVGGCRIGVKIRDRRWAGLKP